MRNGQAGREFGDAAAPGTADLLLGAAHLGEADGAEGVAAVQQFGASARAVVVEANLAFQHRVLGKSLHGGRGVDVRAQRGLKHKRDGRRELQIHFDVFEVGPMSRFEDVTCGLCIFENGSPVLEVSFSA